MITRRKTAYKPGTFVSNCYMSEKILLFGRLYPCTRLSAACTAPGIFGGQFPWRSELPAHGYWACSYDLLWLVEYEQNDIDMT